MFHFVIFRYWSMYQNVVLIIFLVILFYQIVLKIIEIVVGSDMCSY